MKNTVLTTVIAIPNCDQTKLALKWLTKHNIAHVFRDFRVQPLVLSELEEIAEAVGIGKLINKRSTTWRTLGLSDTLTTTELLEQAVLTPTLLKRPMVKTGEKWMVGFESSIWETEFLT